MPTVVTVDSRSGVPIYQQVIDQIKRSVALGTLVPGEQLPTVKALALTLTVNPNTIARAYRDLEREQIIETSPGRGSFVRGNGVVGEMTRAVADVAAKAVGEAVREARSLGVARPDLECMVERAIARWYPEETR